MPLQLIAAPRCPCGAPAEATFEGRYGTIWERCPGQIHRCLACLPANRTEGIKLTRSVIAKVIEVGGERAERFIRDGYQSSIGLKVGSPEELAERNIQSLFDEAALASLFHPCEGLKWHREPLYTHEERCRTPDVSVAPTRLKIDLKGITNPKHGLVVPLFRADEDHKRDWAFVLALNYVPGIYRFGGWVWGREGERPEWLMHQSDNPEQLFWRVPQASLRPMHDLWCIAEGIHPPNRPLAAGLLPALAEGVRLASD